MELAGCGCREGEERDWGMKDLEGVRDLQSEGSLKRKEARGREVRSWEGRKVPQGDQGGEEKGEGGDTEKEERKIKRKGRREIINQ